MLRAASEPYATSAQFSRAVAEGKSDTDNSDHDWLLRERVCNGADVRTAKGPCTVKAPCKNSTHFPAEAAIASHLLAPFKRSSKISLPDSLTICSGWII